MKLDNESLELLQSQARKLLHLSATMDTWQQSKYGPRLRFCDTATLEDVRTMWEFYAIQRDVAETESFKHRFEVIVKSKIAMKRRCLMLSAFRSTFPAPGEFAPFNLNNLHFHYWGQGSLELDFKIRA